MIYNNHRIFTSTSNDNLRQPYSKYLNSNMGSFYRILQYLKTVEGVRNINEYIYFKFTIVFCFDSCWPLFCCASLCL